MHALVKTSLDSDVTDIKLSIFVEFLFVLYKITLIAKRTLTREIVRDSRK